MRRLLPALALAFALPAAAQTAYVPPDEAGVYGELGISGGYSSSGGWLGVPAAAVGYRTAGGLSVGLHAAAVQVGLEHESVGVGPEVRLARALDDRTRLDLYASGTLGLYRGPALDADALRLTGVSTRLAAAATRRADLGRGLTLAVMGGAYGALGRRFAYEAGGVDGQVDASVGVMAGVQLEFDVLGARVGVGPGVAVPLLRTPGRLGFGADIHTAGSGPMPGFLTVRF